MARYVIRWLWVLCGLILLDGCQLAPPPAQAQSAVVSNRIEVPAKPAETSTQRALRLLLLNGDYALAHDQLLTPITDNAYDYFHAVLTLDPNNQQARSGLQGIVLRYVDMARQAAAKGQYTQAVHLLNNARMVDPKNILVKEVSDKLAQQIAALPAPAPFKAGDNEFVLDAAQLAKHDPQLASSLSKIAHKLQESESLAIIVARSDTEGRWIYHQLSAAVPGYRVRGDIKIGHPPRVKLVPILKQSEPSPNDPEAP